MFVSSRPSRTSSRSFVASSRPSRWRSLLVAAALAAFAAVGLAPAGASAATSPLQALEGFDPSPVRYVRLGGDRFGYRTVGKGRPLVLVIGFGATMPVWDPEFVVALAEHRRVIVFDNRGMGESQDASFKNLTIAKMARDTARLIRKLIPKRKRADVLGWSMGGYIAQELALRHPKQVRRLVLAASDPGSPHAVEPKPWVLKILNDPNSSEEDLLKILFPPDQIQRGEAWYARIPTWPGLDFERAFAEPAFEAQVKACGRPWYGRGRGTFSRLGKIRARTLVAVGNRDVVEPPRNSRMLARRIPNARLAVYPDAGHGFLAQMPRRFAGRVVRFLDR